MIDPPQVKADSERIILDAGGRVCEWLPFLDNRTPRTRDAIIGRALVLNAMIQIAFNAPTNIIKDWLINNGASDHLSANERNLLEKENDDGCRFACGDRVIAVVTEFNTRSIRQSVDQPNRRCG